MTDKNIYKFQCARGFTLIELMLSMALIAMAIVILVQTSGMFNDRLLMLQKRAEAKTALMHLALYLDDLHGVMNVATRCGQISSEISCIFYSGPGGAEKRMPIFSLAQYGFTLAEWGTDVENNLTRNFLQLTDGKSKQTIIHYGIFPGVTVIQ